MFTFSIGALIVAVTVERESVRSFDINSFPCELKLRVAAGDEIAGKLGVFGSGVFPYEMAALQHAEVAFWQPSMKALSVGDRDERIVASHDNLTRCHDLRKPFGETGEGLRVGPDEIDRIPEPGALVAGKVVLQRVVRWLV